MLNINKIFFFVSIIFLSQIYANTNFKINSNDIKVRGKIITEDNVIVTYSQKVYKLTFLGTPYTKKRLRALLKNIKKQVSIDISSVLRRYFKNPREKYKVVLYNLNENDVAKIQTILNDVDISREFSFVLSGEKRVYPYSDFLTPVIGYNKKQINKKTDFTYLSGVSGIEKTYNDRLAKAEDIHLNIDFNMQSSLEKELYELKALYDAQELISVVLDTDTFYIKAFASSNKYNPKSIKQKDFANLDVHGIQYLFELNKFAPLVKDVFYLNAKNPIYRDLELGRQSGIDLAHERIYNNANIKDLKRFKVNFMQLVKAYSPFYSGGYIGNPKIEKMQEVNKKQIISKELAQKFKEKLDKFFNTMPGQPVILKFGDRELSASIYMKNFIQNRHHYMKAYFIINNLKKETIPFKVLVNSDISSSNQYFSCTIYLKRNNHKIGQVIQPINKYQANKRKETEREIVGIYKAKDGNYYIDSITTKGTKTASCNACQIYNIETFQVTEDKLISKGLRNFDIDSYTQYSDYYHPNKLTQCLRVLQGVRCE